MRTCINDIIPGLTTQLGQEFNVGTVAAMNLDFFDVLRLNYD